MRRGRGRGRRRGEYCEDHCTARRNVAALEWYIWAPPQSRRGPITRRAAVGVLGNGISDCIPTERAHPSTRPLPPHASSRKNDCSRSVSSDKDYLDMQLVQIAAGFCA